MTLRDVALLCMFGASACGPTEDAATADPGEVLSVRVETTVSGRTRSQLMLGFHVGLKAEYEGEGELSRTGKHVATLARSDWEELAARAAVLSPRGQSPTDEELFMAPERDRVVIAVRRRDEATKFGTWSYAFCSGRPDADVQAFVDLAVGLAARLDWQQPEGLLDHDASRGLGEPVAIEYVVSSNWDVPGFVHWRLRLASDGSAQLAVSEDGTLRERTGWLGKASFADLADYLAQTRFLSLDDSYRDYGSPHASEHTVTVDYENGRKRVESVSGGGPATLDVLLLALEQIKDSTRWKDVPPAAADAGEPDR